MLSLNMEREPACVAGRLSFSRAGARSSAGTRGGGGRDASTIVFSRGRSEEFERATVIGERGEEWRCGVAGCGVARLDVDERGVRRGGGLGEEFGGVHGCGVFGFARGVRDARKLVGRRDAGKKNRLTICPQSAGSRSPGRSATSAGAGRNAAAVQSAEPCGWVRFIRGNERSGWKHLCSQRTTSDRLVSESTPRNHDCKGGKA